MNVVGFVNAPHALNVKGRKFPKRRHNINAHGFRQAWGVGQALDVGNQNHLFSSSVLTCLANFWGSPEGWNFPYLVVLMLLAELTGEILIVTSFLR